jgi:hypothetical protein
MAPKVQEPIRVTIDDFDVLLEVFTAELKKLGKEYKDNSGRMSVSVEMKKDTEAFVKALELIKDELSGEVRKIKIPEVNIPAYPKSISINEAKDIVEVLKVIVNEVKGKKLIVNLKGIEEGLKKIVASIPDIPELPLEDGRVKVILPDYQVQGLQVKTELGKKIKEKTGQFVGGMTVNPNLSLKDTAGNQINPAKEDGNLSYLAPATGGGDGTMTLSVAGTPEKLSTTSKPCRRVYITAHESNNGTIVIGFATVVGALAGRRGKALFPTQGDWFNVSNLNLLWVDGTQNNDKAHYYYES